jgi:mono/diheme cytochrome c family protein
MPSIRPLHIVVVAIIVLIALVVIRLHSASGQVAQPNSEAINTSGLRLAQRLCADCHTVEARTDRPGRAAPNFTAVARMPSTTELALKVFLRSNHRSMPNIMLAEAETERLVAYILSLKER